MNLFVSRQADLIPAKTGEETRDRNKIYAWSKMKKSGELPTVLLDMVEEADARGHDGGSCAYLANMCTNDTALYVFTDFHRTSTCFQTA